MAEGYDNLIWYAAYGSNLCESRFLRYIDAATRPGNDADALPVWLERDDLDLFFAHASKRWSGQGVAFVRSVEAVHTSASPTVFRLYLLTRSQFEDLHGQECALETPIALPKNLPGDLEHVDPVDRLYGRVLGLGQHEDGLPLLTITTSREFQEPNPPSKEYLRTIAKGLTETCGWSQPESASYLSSKTGLRELIDAETLQKILGTAFDD